MNSGPQPWTPMVRYKPGITDAIVEARYQAAVNGGPEEQKAYEDCFEDEA